ncbi:Holliday junction resolvase RuvX [Patescibacteria group bacterium]|nr:Holliday junction resolvase RuvX [Patescibacteria group bacterium]MCG2694929.1 Holliday junction resolvase RuvX [Candidatus Parcubacteria bacterium]
MKYLGIDYGLKNVGIAVSDDEGKMAFAKIVLDNDEALLRNIKKIIKEDRVEEIVLGESLNLSGELNLIMKKIIPFKKKLEDVTGLKVHFQKELFTSAEAERVQGQSLRNVRKSERKEKKVFLKKNDASAAALILRSYLDKK